MDENDEKRRKLMRLLKRLLSKPKPRLGRGGSGGGRSGSITKMRKTPYNYPKPSKPTIKPKQEKTYGTGKVEPWTEPTKQKVRKIVKHEVDSEKLLKELENGIEETLDKLGERLQDEIKQETEARDESKEKNNEIDAPRISDDEEAIDYQIQESKELSLEDLLESADDEVLSELDSLAEPIEDLTDQSVESEIDQDFEAELILYNPEFWQEVGNDLWGEFEPIEPPAEYAPIEEAVME